MICPSCREQNPSEANFCVGCGARLAQSCASCGTVLPRGSRFCYGCGTAVAAVAGAPARSTSPESYTPKHLAEKIISSKSSLEGERKQITVLDDLPLDRVLSMARGSAAIPRSRVSRIRVIRSGVRRRARSIFCS